MHPKPKSAPTSQTREAGLLRDLRHGVSRLVLYGLQGLPVGLPGVPGVLNLPGVAELPEFTMIPQRRLWSLANATSNSRTRCPMTTRSESSVEIAAASSSRPQESTASGQIISGFLSTISNIPFSLRIVDQNFSALPSYTEVDAVGPDVPLERLAFVEAWHEEEQVATTPSTEEFAAGRPQIEPA